MSTNIFGLSEANMERKQRPLVDVTVSLPEEVRAKLAMIADREDRSVSHAARNLLKWAVCEFERRLEMDPSADITPDMLREAGWLASLRTPNERTAREEGWTAGGSSSSI